MFDFLKKRCVSSEYNCLIFKNKNWWEFILFTKIDLLSVGNGLNIHTDIHNWPLQSFSQDYGLASHTTPVVCVNFTRKWRDLQFNVDSETTNF